MSDPLPNVSTLTMNQAISTHHQDLLNRMLGSQENLQAIADFEARAIAPWRSTQKISSDTIVDLSNKVEEQAKTIEQLRGRLHDQINQNDPDTYSDCDKELARMTEEFLRWSLPLTVCSDPCVTKLGTAGRTGTNLMSYVEAYNMFQDHVGPLLLKLNLIAKENQQLKAGMSDIRTSISAFREQIEKVAQP